MASVSPSIASQLTALDADDHGYASRFVQLLLDAAAELQVSDVHVHPTAEGLCIRWRRDGVLQPLGVFPEGRATQTITRLKVLAELLTYRTDIPQEGRIRQSSGGMDMRVSTFPTLHGERAVIRLFAVRETLERLEDLGFPAETQQRLQELISESSGAILITGPAGSGKTTTAYACLRELARPEEGLRSLVSLEDPIEVAVDGVAQSQVNPAAGFTLASGLRSLMRQDPEVILIGEIRDPETAEIAFQASLTGHLVLSTLHAGSSTTAISRLVDMGIEEYLLKSGMLAVLNQRLLRRLCACKQPATDALQWLGLPVRRAWLAAGCDACYRTGYQGRRVLVELLDAQASDALRGLLRAADSQLLERGATTAGMVSMWRRACEAVERGETSPREIRRVLGTKVPDVESL